jgi:hypothetical protein
MLAGNLEELQEIPFIIKEICDRPLFAKLVFNTDTEDPANKLLPVGSSNYDLLAFKQVLPYLKIIDVSEEGQNVYVNVYFGKSIRSGNTSEFKENYLFVDVFVHQDLWKIDTGIRTYSILSEIDRALNRTSIQYVTEELHFLELKALASPNPKYAGFGLTYTKVDNGIKYE